MVAPPTEAYGAHGPLQYKGTFSLSKATPGNGEVTLEWEKPVLPAGITFVNYMLAHDNAKQSGRPTHSISNIDTTSYLWKDLDNDKEYKFYLHIVTREHGFSSPGAALTATPFDPNAQPPGQPTLIDYTISPRADPKSGFINFELRWAPPTTGGPVERYKVEYKKGTIEDVIADWGSRKVVITGTSAEIKKLSKNEKYAFRVTATNAHGDGDPAVTNVDMAKPTPLPTKPGAPKNLQIEKDGNNYILSWEKPDDDGGFTITKYYPEHRKAGDDDWVKIAGRSQTEFGLTSMGNGDGYSFRVVAENVAGKGAYSDVLDKAPPIIALNGDKLIYVKQGGSYAPPGYTATDDMDSTVAVTVTGTVNTAVIGSTTITYTATDSAGNPATETRTVKVAGKPDTIGDLSAAPGDSEVTLTWTAPGDGGSPITGYEVHHKIKGASDWGHTETTADTTYTVEGLTNGETYEFAVAVGTELFSLNFNDLSVPIEATPHIPPSAPTGLTLTPGATQVELSWSVPTSLGDPPITDYVIEYKRGTGDWTTFDDGVSDDTTTTVTPLVKGQEYSFRVAATGGAGIGPHSDIKTAIPRTVPAAPTGLFATSSPAGAMLQWAAPADTGGAPITGYVIGYAVDDDDDDDTSPLETRDTGSTDTMAAFGDLLNGRDYVFHVKAVNQAGTGPVSDTVTATIPASEPYKVENLVASASDVQDSVTLSWDAPIHDGGEAISDYIVEYSADSGSTWTTFADGVKTDTSVVIPDLDTGVSYNFKVTATNSIGQGLPSDVITFTPQADTADTAATATEVADSEGTAESSAATAAALQAPVITVTNTVTPGGTIEVDSDSIMLTGTIAPAGELVLRDSELNYVRHILPAGNADTTSWRQAIGGLQPGNNTFHLEARSSADSSVRSDPVEITIRADPPQVPAITVTATDGTGTVSPGGTIEVDSDSIMLTGTIAPAGELVLRDSDMNYVRHILPAGNADTTSWRQAIGGLQPGDNTFHLEARAADDSSVRSDPFEIVIRSNLP